MAQALQVGFLGGGQLARMMAEAAIQLKCEPVIFCQNKTDPAAQIASKVVLGSAEDPKALTKFFKSVEVVLFESDFLPYQAIEAAAEEAEPIFVPELDLMKLLSNKIRQKKLFQMLKIPAPEFEAFDPKVNSPEAWVEFIWDKFNAKVVFKWARGGYDGKGVFIPDSAADLKAAKVFCSTAAKQGLIIFAEERINFRRELAMSAAFSIEGEFKTYPLVVSEQKEGICRRVIGPAKNFGIKESLEKEAAEHLRRLAKHSDLYGVFAIEFFEDQAGNLLANEIAPRVHNSAHYSLNCSETSQFENHLRAILGRNLGSTNSKSEFAMLNLIASKEKLFEKPPMVCEYATEGVFPYWYGKRDGKPGRKMGHINFQLPAGISYEKAAATLEGFEKNWLAEFK